MVMLRERFSENWIGEPNSGCWLWTGCVNHHGYGRLGFNRRVIKAHRASYELHRGPIPTGMYVCHKCDTPSCVNPAHLFLGTAAQNAADRVAKGRQQRGSRVGTSKLKEADVATILADTRRHADIAADFGVCRNTVALIKCGLAWGHIQ